MSSKRPFDPSQESTAGSKMDSSSLDGTGERRLPGELAELEHCLAALKPDWSPNASSDMLYQVALQAGIEQGRKEGRLIAKQTMRRNVWLGSVASGAAGLAASLLLVLVINGGMTTESGPSTAERERASSDHVGAEERDTTQTAGSDSAEAGSDSAEENQVSPPTQFVNIRNDAGDESKAIGSMRSLISRFSQYEENGGVGSTQWFLDRGAILDFQTQYVEQAPDIQQEKRSDYLNRRTRMLEDADVL